MIQIEENSAVRLLNATEDDSLALLSDFVPNPFSSVSCLCEELGLPESKFSQGWRLTEFVKGQIEGLPGSMGRVVATDGMMCIIVKEDESFYIGHYAWFVVEKDEDKERLPSAKGTKRKAKCLIEFIC